MKSSNTHTFHIPVLGTGFSIDSPIKVAKYGISSVVSLVDDTLMEQLREHYCNKYSYEYSAIGAGEEDARAKRITAYLNMLGRIVDKEFNDLKNSPFETDSELQKYFEMLPEISELKIKYNEMLFSEDKQFVKQCDKWLKDNIYSGSIDVNIMTKLDKSNYDLNGNILPAEFNDAHSALRGFANSDLHSSIIFSAGMNPKLFTYMTKFDDFYPDTDGKFVKKIIIKVSDFRSALIHGKFLAKKGLWVSEYRIESGLNCGGHAFASDGYLLGPIMEEFKNRRDELLDSNREMLAKSFLEQNKNIDVNLLNLKITVQGGVGNFSEQKFLIRKYGVDSVGWGTPFLLVPEVMNVDDETLINLSEAKEDDLYLSDSSPLGVPFNNLRSSGKEIEKEEKIILGKAGSSCPKKFLISNTEFSDKPICTASLGYINKKTDEFNKTNVAGNNFQSFYKDLGKKSCLCVGLAASTLKTKNIESKYSGAVAVCPGPNMAYFSKIVTLKEMVDHIYGKINLITRSDRPNMFLKELMLYIDYFSKKLDESSEYVTNQSQDYLDKFYNNLQDGITYYKNLIPEILEEKEIMREQMLEDLLVLENKLLNLALKPA
ncbi:MAG: hypothetical protein CVV23_07300 [Ignavibacteriae bacterium HGW-Ignavibacteriae-2]|jgi:hypothetical protein|nr:MAG: hypothetical protein CVV23_07300 [Ignavibacteriae bacterium HGW-Ignavibacteriae-2]